MERPSVPNGVLPYLTVTSAADAIEFYTNAFGAEELYRQTTAQLGMEGDDKILHAEVQINGGRLMLSDDFPEMSGGPGTPDHFGGTPVTLHIQVDDVDATLAAAQAAGATVTMPAEDMFWGDRYAKVTDPFGHSWSMATSKG